MGKRVSTFVMTPSGPSQKDGEVMKILNTIEPWSEYTLEDGHTLRIKQIVTKIIKLDETDPLGNPVYVSEGQAVMSVE